MAYVGNRFTNPEPGRKKVVYKSCGVCKRKFPIRPFERNMFCWAMKHTETVTYENPTWVCQKCKTQLNLFITKVLMEGKKWEVVDQNES